MPNYLTKSQLVEKIGEQHSELSKRDIKGIIESLASVGHKELKKAGVFLVPGFAKFVVIKKPATKAREAFASDTTIKTLIVSDLSARALSCLYPLRSSNVGSITQKFMTNG